MSTPLPPPLPPYKIRCKSLPSNLHQLLTRQYTPKRREIIPKAHSLQSRVKIQIPGLGLPGHLDGSNRTVVVVPQYVVLIKLPPSDPYQRHGNYFAGQEPHSQENPTMSFGAIEQHSYSYWSSLPPPPPLLRSLNDFNTCNCDASHVRNLNPKPCTVHTFNCDISGGCSYVGGMLCARVCSKVHVLSTSNHHSTWEGSPYWQGTGRSGDPGTLGCFLPGRETRE